MIPDEGTETRRRHRSPVTLTIAGFVVAAVVIGVAWARGSGGDREDRVAVASTEPSAARGSTPARTRTIFNTRGDAVDVVDGWHLTDARMTQLANPSELFSLATFPLDMPRAPAVCVGDAPPAGPVAVMGPDDVYLWLIEWYPMDSRMPSVATTPARPEHFVLDEHFDRRCIEAASPHVRGGSIGFHDRGRVFNLFFVVGTNVTGDRAHLVEAVLDSLSFAA